MKNELIIFCFLALFVFTTSVSASEDNEFVTIVNPVRISRYNSNPGESLSAQYAIIKNHKLPATWLFTFDALNHPDLMKVAKQLDPQQDLGVFLEVSPDFSKQSAVEYHQSGSWHFANSVFLSGYTQEERIKLIDTVFAKFKSVFGSYPVSFGSWWTDSFSMHYIRDKYGSYAHLGLADQFLTDNYQVWGQYWSTPFYPSKLHAGMPASIESSKLDVVTIPWAPRDPLNGYKSSLYSTQDYLTLYEQKLDTNYFKKLVNLYASKNLNDFGHITVGLEADFPAEVYKGEYSKQIETVASSPFHITNLKQFADWYRKHYPQLSPPSVIYTEQIIWYQSPHYRVGILIDPNNASILDLRSYHPDFREPYYSSPNRQRELRIYIPSYIDSQQNPREAWQLNIGQFQKQSGDHTKLHLDFSEGFIELSPDSIDIKAKSLKIPSTILLSPLIHRRSSNSGIKLSFKDNWLVPPQGYTFEDYTPEATHIFKAPRTFLRVILSGKWSYLKKTTYVVTQSEIDALFRLQALPPGKILVVDKECLQCSWHAEHRPAVFANKRQYVSKFSKHSTVFDSNIFNLPSPNQAKQALRKLNVKYIYLVKYEDYQEILPFSPGDWGAEKIFQNAQAEIWEVK